MLRVLARPGCISFLAMLSSVLTGAEAPPNEAFPFERIGSEAQKQYSGDGIAILPEGDGARLRVAFQKLEASATKTGLWLESTEDTQGAERFRLLANEFGRLGAGDGTVLARVGKVVAGEAAVSFARPGLVEEYRVGMDGVRQDFVVLERPGGDGELQVLAEVAGAVAETFGEGIRLTLSGSGRKIAYTRLHVTDASGRELEAGMEAVDGTRVRILVDDTDAVYPVRVDPTFSDADWVAFGGLAGTDGEVRAIHTDGSGNLYIGGNFAVVGETLANCVAKWDGSTWSPLGEGMDGEVTAFAVLGGDLYVGGGFYNAGGQAAKRIAKWDGSGWSPLGSGLNARVDALAVSGGDLYVGGGFTAAGGQPASRVAKWDGSAWSALGDGVDAAVYAMAMLDGDLYAGGDFTAAGGHPANRIAKWDGSAWSALGSGMNFPVYALAVLGQDLCAGGFFTTAGGVGANRVAKWNGIAWSALGGGFSGNVRAFAVDDGVLYAGGLIHAADGIPVNNIAKWDGANWTALGDGVGDPNDSSVFAMGIFGGELYAGGMFTSAGGLATMGLATWDGEAWAPPSAGMGLSGIVNALAVAGGKLYVGGNFSVAGNILAENIAKWDGSAWSALGDGVDSSVYALAADGENLYVGGQFGASGELPISRIAKWDGSAWSPLGDGVTGTVFSLAWSDGNLYAGGLFSEAGGLAANNIAKWNGSAWSPLAQGIDSYVYALSSSDGDLYAGGSFSEAGGTPANNIAKWDGSAWSSLGSGTNSDVNALVRSGSDLYVGGSFSSAGGQNISNLAKWDGVSWSPLGDGLSDAVFSLIFLDGDLYAGGYFSEAGGMPASRIAKWDGAAWSPLGAGLNRETASMAEFGGDLYVGGYFTTAGGKVSTHLARAVLHEIILTGNGVEIENGDSTPAVADHSDFGSTSALGGTIARTFTIASAGSADLTLTDAPTAVVVTGSEAFSVSQQPASPIAPDDETTFTITFAPGTPGDHSATVSIASNDADRSPFTFAIAGFGTLPQIDVTGNSVSIPDGSDTPSSTNDTDFGSASALGGNVARTFTVANGGNAELTLTDAPAAVALGGSSAFSVTQQAASPLAPDADTTFIVTFAPDTPGAHNATVSIASNDADRTPYTFALAGFATLPQITVSGNGSPIPDGSATPGLDDHTDFGSASTLGGSVARTFTVANEGDEDLALTDTPAAVSLSGSSAFSVTQQPASPLAPDGESPFIVTFAPTAPGPHSATVSIANNDPGKDPYTFALSGTGIQPTLSVLGNGSSIPTGSGAPGAADHRQFGPVRFPAGNNTRTFTLANTGSATLNFTGGPDFVSISGSSAFTVTAQPGGSITPGNEATFTISFAPDSPGLHTATVSIASDDPETGVYSFTIQGSGVQALISVKRGAKTLASGKGTLRFATVAIRKRGKPLSFSIRNEGSDDLVGLKISTKGPHRRDFRITRPGRRLLIPGQATPFKTTFHPASKGNRRATLEIGSNAANWRTFRIKVTGRGK